MEPDGALARRPLPARRWRLLLGLALVVAAAAAALLLLRGDGDADRRRAAPPAWTTCGTAAPLVLDTQVDLGGSSARRPVSAPTRARTSR